MTSLDSILRESPPPGASHTWLHRCLVAIFRHDPACPDRQAVELVARRFPDGNSLARLAEIRGSTRNARAFAAAHPLRQKANGEPWKPLSAFRAPPPPSPPPSAWSTPPRAPLNELLVLTAEGACPNAWERLANGGKRAPGLPDDRQAACLYVLRNMYQQGDFVCAGPDPRSVRTQTLAEWGDAIAETAVLVPSPMAARTGLTKDGRQSCRCIGNAAQRRRYVVIEHDGPSLERQAARIAWLSALLPGRLKCLVFSGNKSIHAFFEVAGLHPGRLRCWFRTAVALGADPMLWVAHQCARLPLGVRHSNGVVQEVLFLRETPLL
jgi:hypothetical protein